MPGAAFLWRRRIGELITAGAGGSFKFSSSESVASGVVNEEVLVAGVVSRTAGVAVRL